MSLSASHRNVDESVGQPKPTKSTVSMGEPHVLTVSSPPQGNTSPASSAATAAGRKSMAIMCAPLVGKYSSTHHDGGPR